MGGNQSKKKNFEVAWRTNPHKKYRAPNRRKAANPARQKKSADCMPGARANKLNWNLFALLERFISQSLSESASNKVNYGLFA